jgi:hypothetical protein
LGLVVLLERVHTQAALMAQHLVLTVLPLLVVEVLVGGKGILVALAARAEAVLLAVVEEVLVPLVKVLMVLQAQHLLSLPLIRVVAVVAVLER